MQHSPIILDVAGTELTSDDRRRLQHPLVGGVIYFSRNCKSRQQMADLSSAIKAIRPDAIISIDHEGGRVQRFRSDGFTHLPPMRTLGQMWQAAESKSKQGHNAMQAAHAARACGYVLATELRACGIDFSYTPVLDLDYGNSAVIGDRAFASDPRVTSILAQNLMHGLLQAGMKNCGKHFPGHGYVEADSHVAIPIDRRGERTILAQDALPYGWLNNSLNAIMPAHVIYPKICPNPAGFSRYWLRDVLRTQLQFTGAIISDDLTMEGARQLQGKPLGLADAVCAAVRAGCDLTLICNQSIGGSRVLDDVLENLSKPTILKRLQNNKAAALRRQALLATGTPLQWADLRRSEAYKQARAVVGQLKPQ